MKQKIFLVYLMLIVLLKIDAQTLQVEPNNCFDVQYIGNNQYQLNSLVTAQCSNCYYWEITPSSGINIIGSNTSRSLIVELGNNSRGTYNINLIVFKNGQCSSCSTLANVLGPCGCSPECSICFNARETHFFSPPYSGNLNEAAGLSVNTTIQNHCSACIDYISYDIYGSVIVDNSQQGVYLQNLGSNHYLLKVYDTYWSNNNQLSFDIISSRDMNASYTAKIYFRTGFIVDIDGYHLCHSDIDHNCSVGTRNDCWSPDDGIVSSRPNINLNEVNEIKIYPNPASNNINVTLPPDFKRTFNIIIFNQQGNIIYKKNNLKNGFSIPIKKWRKGNYIVKIYYDNHVLTRLLMVD